MGFSAIHRPHAIVFPAVPDVVVTQLTDVRPNFNYQELVERSAAEPAPQWSGAIGAAPEIAFDSRQLKTILDLVAAGDGVCKSYAPAGGTVSVYYRQGANRGLREAVATATHNRYDLANTAMIYWNSISADQRGIAQIECALRAVSTDGIAAPIAHVGAIALSGDSAVGNVYTLGPVSLNGAWLNSVVSARLENGFTFDAEDESGNAWQQYYGIDEWNPRVTIDLMDIDTHGTIGTSGLALTALKLYFRKLTKGTVGPVIAATAEHIKFTASAGTVLLQEGSGMKARYRITMALEKPNAATAPFTVDTASAIVV